MIYDTIPLSDRLSALAYMGVMVYPFSLAMLEFGNFAPTIPIDAEEFRNFLESRLLWVAA